MCTATQPTSARFELVDLLRGVTRRFLTCTFPSRLPDPRCLAVPVRPVVVGAAFRSHPHLPARTAPSFALLLRQHGGRVPFTSARSHSASWRTKTQIQALDRSAPVLPMMPGMPERRTHDYIRHGITTLFAALDVASGEVIGSIHRRHRATEFRKFLAKLDKQVPAELDVHLICDNYSTHKAPTVRAWLDAHPRF